MWPWLKYAMIASAVVLGLAVATVVYSFERDQARFRAAKNQCERDCIQDSGSIETCRPICANHPDAYGPNVKPTRASPAP
jgi:hypothetical protein